MYTQRLPCASAEPAPQKNPAFCRENTQTYEIIRTPGTRRHPGERASQLKHCCTDHTWDEAKDQQRKTTINTNETPTPSLYLHTFICTELASEGLLHLLRSYRRLQKIPPPPPPQGRLFKARLVHNEDGANFQPYTFLFVCLFVWDLRSALDGL